MGNLFSRKRPVKDEPEEEEFSWSNRKLDPAQFMVMDKKGETVIRTQGEIAGNQFIIEGCTDCTIYLADWADSMTVDLCKGCTIFLAGCNGSVFVRDCQDCRFVLVCQQFRTRDCTDCHIDLFARTRPIIESSSALTMSCYSGPSFDGHADIMKDAGLDPFINIWYTVHDFTEQPGETHYKQITKEPITAPESMPDAPCPVPQTIGRKKGGDVTHVVIPATSAPLAMRLAASLNAGNDKVAATVADDVARDTITRLVKTGDEQPGAYKTFFTAACDAGRVIVLEVAGVNAPFALSDAMAEWTDAERDVAFIVHQDGRAMVEMTWMSLLDQH